MTVSICIPVRLKSTRFPNKLLADLCGKSVLQHVFDRARMCLGVNNIFILTDAEIIYKTALAFGASVIKTSEDCTSGTERIVSVLNKIDGDFIINIQGDEPFFDIGIIERMLIKIESSDADIFTPIFKLEKSEDVFNPNCVKVVINSAEKALYFSRNPIPYVRDEENRDKWIDCATYYGHIGIYGYRRHVLENYNNMVLSELEAVEKLEQLRFLDNGYTINTIETTHNTIGIDTPEDLKKARNLLNC